MQTPLHATSKEDGFQTRLDVYDSSWDMSVWVIMSFEHVLGVLGVFAFIEQAQR